MSSGYGSLNKSRYLFRQGGIEHALAPCINDDKKAGRTLWIIIYHTLGLNPWYIEIHHQRQHLRLRPSVSIRQLQTNKGMLTKNHGIIVLRKSYAMGTSEGAFGTKCDGIPKSVTDLWLVHVQFHLKQCPSISGRTHSLIHILLSGLTSSIRARDLSLICPPYPRRFQGRFPCLSQYLRGGYSRKLSARWKRLQGAIPTGC